MLLRQLRRWENSCSLLSCYDDSESTSLLELMIQLER
jgi:hypothetical protein